VTEKPEIIQDILHLLAKSQIPVVLKLRSVEGIVIPPANTGRAKRQVIEAQARGEFMHAPGWL
jgi:hypothetical protein